MTMFFRVFFALMLVVLARSQEEGPLPPPRNTRVRWGDVRPTSFKVTWSGPKDATMYNVFLYQGYTSEVMREYEHVTDEYLMIRDLQTYTIYGVKVQCDDGNGRLSKLGRAGRTRTFGTPTTTTTTTPAPTAPTPVGSCGIGFFTCETNETECVDESWWCDRKNDCRDGTDERNCPGSCVEITEFHPAGNFSCSRFNSRKSACFFQCNGDFQRDGPYYTVCVHDEWTRRIPTCKLMAPKRVEVVNDGTRPTAIDIQFNSIDSAASYEIDIVIDVATGEAVTAAISYGELDGDVNILVASITGLEGGKSYVISVAGIDEDGVQGVGSQPVVGNTAPPNDRNKEDAIE